MFIFKDLNTVKFFSTDWAKFIGRSFYCSVKSGR